MRIRSVGAIALAAYTAMFIWPSGRGSFAAEVAKRGPSPVVETCVGANLSIRCVDGDAAMGGARGIYYAFKNRGTEPCTLDGVPRVELLNHHGHVVHANLVKYADEHSLVTLTPGQEAFLEIDYHTTGAGDHGRHCPSVPRIRIKLPGTNRWFVRREGLDLCSNVNVDAVVATNPLAP